MGGIRARLRVEVVRGKSSPIGSKLRLVRASVVCKARVWSSGSEV